MFWRSPSRFFFCPSVFVGHSSRIFLIDISILPISFTSLHIFILLWKLKQELEIEIDSLLRLSNVLIALEDSFRWNTTESRREVLRDFYFLDPIPEVIPPFVNEKDFPLEQGRIHGIRCVHARTASNFGRKRLFCRISTRVWPTDRQTDGRTDRRMDGRTDRPTYRDARTHLKSHPTLRRRLRMRQAKSCALRLLIAAASLDTSFVCLSSGDGRKA